MSASPCIFCQIARSATSTRILHQDDKIVAFQDINPAAFRHYLVIPIEHIPTVKNLQRGQEHFSLVSHMLNVGKTLLQRDASQSNVHRFGFHQPPFNSVDHLHLHCLALPYIPSWKFIKYSSLGPLGGFVKAEKLLEKLKPSQLLPPFVREIFSCCPETFVQCASASAGVSSGAKTNIPFNRSRPPGFH